MDGISLTRLAEEQLNVARSARAGRAAITVHGGSDHMLKQTLMALTGGTEMGEHNSPGQSTLQVLQGQVKVTAGADSWTGGPGDLLVLPSERHNLHADSDAVVLLTVLADSRAAQ
ncbi:cupin domain-containing protein [Mycolicibacterium sp.]|jgi:quercetin dioxygenase-like cupin family protein|uniref:cupin domain-containing protein n=1 Tax=Mycolicibacterium sp. TaxID=2320850 RepID=UPI0028B1508C|nr:cupin domain-containing protein [Mycolicibacterium sp.]